MPLLKDYSGPFDPELSLADFSRQFLVHLGREYLLIGHLLDRVGQAAVRIRYGVDGYVRSGIEEWMGASPVYSRRMQRAMNFEGDDVATVFKNLQLEVGAPQQYMDFQFRLDSPSHGEFWLCHCGALRDAEARGNEQTVKLMCHDIEDPTFDATAAATNPRMIMRPVHRPPRSNAPGGNGEGRYPVCRWTVSISEEAQPYAQHPNLARVAASRLAGIAVMEPDPSLEPGGWHDYSGPFDPGSQLEDFSHRALVIMCQEWAIQTHLLVRAYMLSQAEHYGDEVATELARQQWIGHAGAGVVRLQEFLGIRGDDIQAMAKVFQLHPGFQPRTYIDFRVAITGERSLRLSIGDCPALEEGDIYSWFAQLGTAPHPAIETIAGTVNPRARCYPADAAGAARFAWDVVIDPEAAPRPEPFEMQIARASSGLSFHFEQRRTLRL